MTCKGLTEKEAESILLLLFNSIRSNLQSGKDVMLPNICVLGSKDVEEHNKKGFGTSYKVSKYKKLICRQSSTLFPKNSKKIKTVDDSDLNDLASKLNKLNLDNK